jgi:hypothetical protein
MEPGTEVGPFPRGRGPLHRCLRGTEAPSSAGCMACILPAPPSAPFLQWVDLLSTTGDTSVIAKVPHQQPNLLSRIPLDNLWLEGMPFAKVPVEARALEMGNRSHHQARGLHRG